MEIKSFEIYFLVKTTAEPQELNSFFKEFIAKVRDLSSLCDFVELVSYEDVTKQYEFIIKSENEPQRLGEILLEKGVISLEELNLELLDQKPIGQKLLEKGKITNDELTEALKEQQMQKIAVQKKQKSDPTTSIRVSSLKLDKLVNLIGELVTVQERFSQLVAAIHEIEPAMVHKVLKKFNIFGICEEFGRLISSLRDNALNIRMLPIETIFTKYKRLVHDLSIELNKQIQLVTSGGDTEIDKTVIDKLDEPLVHIIRNSADHGIETPQERVSKGKPAFGTIYLSAEHIGGNVIIHIKDDGKGLDKEAIYKKAVEKKLIKPDAKLSDKEIYNLIFLPGFSTAAKVTNISGRGVGMDVVKKTIEELRGTVEIKTSPGNWTQIDLILPLTLAIIDGLLISINDQLFVVPLYIIEECLELNKVEENKDILDKNVISLRGKLIPIVYMRELLFKDKQVTGNDQIIVCKWGDITIGLVVDKIIGELKTVIKPLGKYHTESIVFSGATILGDGNIALIFDISKIINYIN